MLKRRTLKTALAAVISLAVMAAPAFLLMFITLFFGPLDIVNTNQQYLTFAAGRLFWPLLGLTLAGTLVLAALLALLRGRGFGVGWYGADGEFGAATEEGLRAFQRVKREETDGVCGERTWSRLLKG